MAHIDIIMPARPTRALPEVRRISFADLGEALAKGFDDFKAMPTHVVFLSFIYPVIGFLLCNTTFSYDGIPLLYPIATGFALIGPLAGIWLFELSRRRELGMDTSWNHAFDVLHSPSLLPIVILGLLLLTIFAIWIACAQSIYVACFGYQKFESIGEFVQAVLTTSEGHRLILFGNMVGFGFAVVAAALSAISFPLLLDRDVGFSAAILTSITAVVRNPLIMAAWGIVVAALLALGSLPFFVGLAVVMPVLGHATWHLYRKVVVPDSDPRPEYHPRSTGKRYAAEFPASIFFPAEREEEDR